MTVLAAGYINIEQTGGTLNLNVISNDGKSDIKVIANENILNNRIESAIENILFGKNIYLQSLNGSIGTIDSPVVLSDLNNGIQTVLAKNTICIEEVKKYENLNGDFLLNSSRFSGLDVYITAYGSIIDNSIGDSLPNISGKNITLKSLNGSIGTLDEDLDIDTKYGTSEGSLTAIALNGLINIEEFSGDLDINYVQSEQDVKIVAAGNILDAGSDENPVNIYGKKYLSAG